MISEAVFDQIRHMLRPIKTKIANSIARAVVENVDDSKKIQIVQLGVQKGETVDDGERFQEFGFNSVPLRGAEAVALFPNGDRGHPLIVAVDDRRYRPTGWADGEAGTYNAFSAMMHHKADGTTEITGGGAAAELATKADIDALISSFNAAVTVFNAHVHPGVATGAGSTTATVTPASSASAASGTTKLKGE